MKITDFVFEGNPVNFSRYFDGNLYYIVKKKASSEWYEFSIPIGGETKGAEFPNASKSILFMRWIRKAIADNTLKLIA